MRRVLSRTFDDPKLMPEFIRLDQNIEEAAATDGDVRFFAITEKAASEKHGWFILDGRQIPIKGNERLSAGFPTKGGNIQLPNIWKILPGLIAMVRAG